MNSKGKTCAEAWFVTKFTAERDPTVMSYLGLTPPTGSNQSQAQEHRRKLAETFLRPTTWKDYCEIVSVSNCTIPDAVAHRPPLDDADEGNYFVQGLYTGHFRATEENDCDARPDNCTGHIANYPCDWVSHMEGQLYWMGIPLESNGPKTVNGGYSATQLKELW